MKAIELEERELNNLFRKIFDGRQFVRQGVLCLGFVTGRIVHASYSDNMIFSLAKPDYEGLCSLYARISKALHKDFPDAKILNDILVNVDEADSITVSFKDVCN